MCLLLTAFLAGAQLKVSGTVYDPQGEPLIGASVLAQGANGTQTDIDGRFSINVDPKGSLTISYVGYETQKVSIDGRKEINVTMKENSAVLDEVVVVGYGVVKKSDLTSSISTVKGEKITEVTTGNPMDALQGKVNGVQISSGGGPGTAPKVIIRGVTTVNGSSPLYVVDGIPIGTDINFLNTGDIESMEVLKDASACAIYGTRGSNGVILVTTKKGAEGKPQFNFAASVGFQTLKKPSIADAYAYEQAYKARYTNDGRTPIWNSPKSGYTSGEGTDWWDTVVNKTAMIQNYQFSVSGGTKNYVYNLSVGYFRNDSQFDYGYWDKLNIRLNTEYTFNKYVKAGLDMAPRMESWDDTPGDFGSIIAMDPTTPVFRTDGVVDQNPLNNYQRSYNNTVHNPAGRIARANAHSREFGMFLTPYIQITPLDGLTFRSQFGFNARFRRSDDFSPKFYIDAQEQNVTNQASRKMTQATDWNWTNTLNYTRSFNQKHNLTAMVGFTAEKFADYWVFGSREAIPSNNDALHEVHAGTLNQNSDGNTSYNTLMSYLGRVMYNFDGRYYLTASVRVDGSSKFAEGNKYATFPSVSGAWRISNEPFMRDQTVVDNLKLRLGWGRVGNQNIDSSAYLTLLDTRDVVIGGVRVPGTTISSVGNNKLKWETVEDFDLGLDISVLNSRLDVTFDLYRKKSHDMLYKKENILALGYPNWNGAVTMNIGKMQATGWELSVNWNDRVGDFRYSAGVNLSGVKNKAIKLSGDGPILSSDFRMDKIIRNEDGGEISRFYGFVADGIFQNWTEVYAHTDEHGNLIQPNAQPGDIRFLDLNNNGEIDDGDKTYIGRGYPKLMMGVNLSLAYKNWDFSTNFYGTFGNDVFNTARTRYAGASGENFLGDVLEKAWHGEGTSNDIPRLTSTDLNQNYNRVSSFYVEDGSYFRCKMMQIGYTLPSKLTRGTSLRVYFSTQNLFTITKYSGMDPERPQNDGDAIATGIDWTSYPNPRTFLFGVDFKF